MLIPGEGIVVDIARWIYTAFVPHSRSLALAPTNIFEYAQPYAGLQYLRAVLGEPHRVEKKWATFRFRDLYLQVMLGDSDSVEELSVLTRKPTWLGRYTVYPLHYVLGEVTLADVVESGQAFVVEGSSMFCTVHVQRYFGFPGKYNYYTFGIYSGPGVRSVEFAITKDRSGLATNPEDALVNWIHISPSKGPAPTPNFFHFI